MVFPVGAFRGVSMTGALAPKSAAERFEEALGNGLLGRGGQARDARRAAVTSLRGRVGS